MLPWPDSSTGPPCAENTGVRQVNELVGVVGVACPDEAPLLAFMSLVVSAVAQGNTMVVVPREAHSLSIYQVRMDAKGSILHNVTVFCNGNKSLLQNMNVS